MKASFRNKGFTLIELMVSLAIGLLVALAATQLFVANQQSFNLQRGMGDVQDNGRFALDFMGHDIRLSGAKASEFRLANSKYSRRAVVSTITDSAVADATLLSLDGSSALGIGPASDQLTIQHTSLDDNNRDCEGNVAPFNTVIVNRYFIRADNASNTPSALACDGGYYDPDTGVVTAIGDAGVVLLSGVDSFQALYGINNGGATSCVPVRYVTAAQYNALPNAATTIILAVKIGLVVRSQDTTGGLPASPAFQVLDAAIPATAVPRDGRIRRLFTATMALRNAVPSDC